jgi:hypothetical protein
MAKEDKVLGEPEGSDLNLSNDVMDLEDDGDKEDVEAFLRPQVSITENEVEMIFKFLDHYGIDTDGMTLEEAYKKYQKIQELVQEQIQVLSRGAVLDTFDRLLTHVPKGFKGEFFHDSSTSLDRARALGWQPVKSEIANQDTSTGKADGLVRVGDLVLFQLPEEEYAAKQIARERRHADRRNRRKKEQETPSQGSQGIDPMNSNLGAHPDHPIKPMSQLLGG